MYGYIKGMEEKVRENLIRLGVKEGMLIGAAVSGGVDSMALLNCLCRLRQVLNIRLAVYHFEHGIRGKASEDDMYFVIRECEKLNVKCITERANVPLSAKEKGISLETAAREARYAFLDKQDADFIATAHHSDDVAETVIMNLVRGSGLSGLCGIPEKRGKFIRPLLDVSRHEIEMFARENSIEFVKDATNEDASYTRNYIRKEIIPRLKEINEAAAENITRASRLLAEDESALKRAAAETNCIEEAEDGVYIRLDVFADQETAVKKRIVRQAVLRVKDLVDLENVNVNDIMKLAEKKESGKRIDLAGGLFSSVIYDKLIIGKNEKKGYNNDLMALQTGKLSFGDKFFVCGPYNGKPEYGKDAEYFSACAIKDAQFRFRREGDYIIPLGLGGKKRLSDYLSDRKVPLYKRDSLVLLACGSEVFWVVGVGVSETSKVWEGGEIFGIKYGEIGNG